MKARNQNSDIVRGICIICVVCGHCRAPFKSFIYLFHVAVFFMISGYFWNEKISDDIASGMKYIVRKLKTLWFPYAASSIVYTLLNNWFIHINFYSANESFLELVNGGGVNTVAHYYGIKEILIEIVKDVFFVGKNQLGGAMWFLRVLFFISIGHMILSYVINRLGYPKILWSVVAVVTVVAAEIINLYGKDFPRGIQPLFAAYMAYLLGILLQKLEFEKFLCKNNWLLFCSSLCGLLILNRFGSIEINNGVITNFLFYVTASLFGWALLWYISNLVKGKAAATLQYVGRYSIVILILHFVSFKLVSLLYLGFTKGDIMLLASFPVLNNIPYLWIAYSFAGVTIPIICRQIYIAVCHMVEVKKAV